MALQGRLLRGAALLLVAALAACAADRPPPTALESLAPSAVGRPLWQAKLSGLTFPMGAVSRGGQFVVAGGDGTVLALDASNGREVWRAQANAPLSAGVGADARFAAVVNTANTLVAFDAGQRTWTAALPARTVTPPLVAGERIFVMTVDRVVHAFDALNGNKLWTLQRPGDALTLGQAGLLTAVRDTLVVGQGPRMTGVDPLRGTVRWEVAVASPRGTNEVERLADLVGPPVRLGNDLCVRAFQSAVGCVDAERGALRWSRNAGGIAAVGSAAGILVGADASDRLSAWRQAAGETAWNNEKFLYRGLSGIVGVGRHLAFGDFEGQVHLLNAANGAPVARWATDGSAVVGTPVVQGNTVLVATRAGGLFAFLIE